MPGQDVLDPAPVDVAVDLVGVVGRPGDVVLDQGAPLEHGDLGHLRLDVDADEVAADLLGAPVPARSGGDCATAWPRPRLAPIRPAGSATLGASRPSARWRSGRASGDHRRGRRAGARAVGRRWRHRRRGPGVADLGLCAGRRARRGRRASAALPAASGGRPSGVWLISVSDMRESPPCVLCRAAMRSRARSPGSGSNRAPSRSIH